MSLLARIFITLVVCAAAGPGMAQVADTSPTSQQVSSLYHLSLPEALQLALQHNHSVRIAEARVDERRHATEVAKSAYFPTIRNDSGAVKVTDTQFIQIPAGSLGTGASNQPIPNRAITVSQGGRAFITSGTELTQPLTQLFKIRSVNEMAKADYRASQSAERSVEDEVTLSVHELYYKLLIAQLQRKAIIARIAASTQSQKESEQQVGLGSALEEDLIEARAQNLQAKQDLLALDLQLSDLTLQLNDLIGLPPITGLALDDVSPEVPDVCEPAACIQIARASHPEIEEARAEVEKATAAVRLAKQEYIPNVTGTARYSHQENIPFLARNFGTFGVRIDYTLFDGGRRGASKREAESALAEARENLSRVIDDVDVGVQTAYNRLTRTREMVKVSQELLALREESSRVTEQQLEQGNALQSQADSAAAQACEARTQLLQAQLNVVQAHDQLNRTMGVNR